MAVDIWRDMVTLRDVEGTRRQVALDGLKTEMAAAPMPAGTAVLEPEEAEEPIQEIEGGEDLDG